MKKLLLSLGLLLSLSLSLTGCNDDNAQAQGGDGPELDFLIDIISGAVLENPEGEGFILELEVTSTAFFIEESPATGAGTIGTEFFLEDFNEIFGAVLPNAILTIRDEDGVVDTVAVKLNSVVFEKAQQIARFLVTPLEPLPGVNLPDTDVELSNISDVQTPFGPALIFIDSTDYCVLCALAGPALLGPCFVICCRGIPCL